MSRRRRESFRELLRSAAVHACEISMHALYSWVRYLCSEGIEPNPGPRYITKNVNGIADLKIWETILFNIAREHKKSPIGAVFLQEIRIGEATKHKRMAEEHGLYMLAHGNRSNSSIGGTAIVIPQDMIEKKWDATAKKV